jgi:DNA-binding GntR family transcriptional regulator
VCGALSPGQRLPIEDLADAIGMSPMPIREALRRLDAAGLVENVPHRGARVTELSVADLAEVYDARMVLEVLAIQGAAGRFTAADERVASEWLDRLVSALRRNDRPDALRAHTEFHFALYRAAGSRWLMRLISPLWESAERYRVATVGAATGLRTRIAEHERILDGCREHQSEVAAAELWNHLALTANAVASQMNGSTLYPQREVPKVRSARR